MSNSDEYSDDEWYAEYCKQWKYNVDSVIGNGLDRVKWNNLLEGVENFSASIEPGFACVKGRFNGTNHNISINCDSPAVGDIRKGFVVAIRMLLDYDSEEDPFEGAEELRDQLWK